MRERGLRSLRHAGRFFGGFNRSRSHPSSFSVSSFNFKPAFYSRSVTTVSGNDFRDLGELTSVSDLINVLAEMYEKPSSAIVPLLETSDVQESAAKMVINRKMSLWFRGHSISSLDIMPSLFRGQINKLDGKQAEEPYYVDERSAIFHLTHTRPELREHSLFDVITIAQHHGLPTRLLDWTQSAVNALLFAVSDHNKHDVDGELFILNPFKLNFQITGKYSVFRPEHPEVSLRAELAVCKDYADLTEEKSRQARFYPESVYRNFNARAFLDYKYTQYQRTMDADDKSDKKIHAEKRRFENETLSKPVATFPLWKDSRLLVQQGMFTLHGGKFYFDEFSSEKEKLPPTQNLFDIQEKVVSSGVDNSKAHLQSKDLNAFMCSLRIPAKHKYKIEKELRRIGVHPGLLFPELEHQTTYTKFIWSFPKSGIRDSLKKAKEGSEIENVKEGKTLKK